MIRNRDLNLRDPYILVYEDLYYMYGTRSDTCWGTAEGFDCYVSRDLEEWEGPIEIFRRPKGFFADQNYWAPECYYYRNEFYLVTTFGCENRKKGIYILKSQEPCGPFQLCSSRITPEDWECIDGTLYFEIGTPYLLFSHSFEDSPNGDMCMLELTKDLQPAVSEPVKLFSASQTTWAKPVPFAKEEFGMDGDVYLTDGPFVMRLDDGNLYMSWSSWGTNGYAVGIAVSASGRIAGPWKQLREPIFPENGGHGMMFRDLEGNTRFAMHYPNDKYKERPMFPLIKIENGKPVLEL